MRFAQAVLREAGFSGVEVLYVGLAWHAVADA